MNASDAGVKHLLWPEQFFKAQELRRQLGSQTYGGLLPGKMAQALKDCGNFQG
ncbi:MAG: hypothetical protein LBU32_09155 [Clostridiales bacterium]|nr:hypothetical protein [Clostridiales bacterium]